MLYVPKIPETLLRVTGIVATNGGLVATNGTNSSGSQAGTNLVTGQNFSKWFEVKGRELTLLVAYTKGGETSCQFAFTIFGSAGVPSRDMDVTFGPAGTGVTAVNTDQVIGGVSYPLWESSMGNVQWVTNAFTATATMAIPVHLGVSNRTTPATIPVALTPSAFPGRYARLGVVIAGNPNSSTVINVDLAWSGH